MDRHLALVSVAGYGHVNPTLPLVAELVRRGWRVSYATHERFARAVADAGATLVPTQGDMPAPPPFTDFDPDRFADLLQGFVADARVDVPRLEAHFQRDPPQADLLRLGQPHRQGPGRAARPARRGPDPTPRQQRAARPSAAGLAALWAGAAGAATGPAGDAGLCRRGTGATVGRR